MTILPFGDSALLINFEQKIDSKINQKVFALSNKIEKAKLEEVSFLIPAYCSLTVGFNPNKTTFSSLEKKLYELAEPSLSMAKTDQRKLIIPVCYDEEFALDMSEVEHITNLTNKEIIELHSSWAYNIYMLGFIPGFPYMGVLPKALNCERKAKPRLKVPKGSVAITGAQTCIYPMDVPGGWQIIGKTPLNIFEGNKNEPFLFQAGDIVKFESIDKEKFHQLERDLETGLFNETSIYA